MDSMETIAVPGASSKKAKRYKRPTFGRVRSAKDLPRFRLEETDIDILAAHGRHRVIATDQLIRLLQRNERSVKHRLHCLNQHGYITRPKAQKPTPAKMSTGDGRPIQSVLSRKGKVLLAKRRGVPGQSFDPLAAKGSLEHERGCSEITVRLELGATPERRIEWWHEMVPGFPVHRDRKGDRFKVKLLWKAKNYTLWLRPDRIVAIIDTKKPAEKQRRAYFLERDKGTMPLERSDLVQSSILRKFLGYSAFYLQRKYDECFGFRGFRILLVCESLQRCENMRALFRKYNIPQYKGLLCPQRMFWFCDMATIKAYDDIFEVPWHLADGTIVKLGE